jgi:Protein of unknown function (DUF2384)
VPRVGAKRHLHRSKPGPVPAEDRADPGVRKRLSGPAMRTFGNVMRAWSLGPDEQRALLGWPASATYYKYKAGNVGTLSYDTLTRISLVLGIYRALHLLYSDDALADGWVKLPNSNPLFGGKPALSLMLDGGIDGLTQTRRLLDSRVSG